MTTNKPYGPGKRIRLDRRLYMSANRVYFFTIRAYKNQAPFTDDALSRRAIDLLRDQSLASACRVFSYCLMPDHLHLLASPERNGVSVLEFVDRYKGRSTNESWTLGWAGKLWEPRCYDHIVRADEDLLALSRYILDNPLRKGLASAAERWPWSGLMNPLPV